MLTAYDATFAGVLDDAGVDCLLIGDSLGMVMQGLNSTLPVTLDQMVYHTELVVRGNKNSWVIGDLPFGSYQESTSQAMRSATALMQAGAHMVKLEGGGWTTEIVDFLVQRGVPVCAHLGLTPQSVHALGGYRIQGKSESQIDTLVRDAKALADAGAAMMVLELMPAETAKQVTDAIGIPTIGIGAGVDCSGQVLVLHDMLGITRGRVARFVRNFMNGSSGIDQAIRTYVDDVKAKRYPSAEHSY